MGSATPITPPRPRRGSITYTIAVGFFLVVMLVGLVLIFMGLGGSSAIEIEVAGAKLKTTSMGLAVLGIGALGTVGLLTKMPDEVGVMAGNPAAAVNQQRRVTVAKTLLVVGVIALISAVVVVIAQSA